MAITAAAGYPQYSGVLTHPDVRDVFLERAWASNKLANYTSDEYTGSLKEMGDEVIFRREPVVNIHRYQKNIKLKADTPEISTSKLCVDEGFYWNVKLDRVDIKQMGKGVYGALNSSLMKAGPRAVGYQTEKTVLARMVRDAEIRGNTAVGSLGTIGAPISVTKDNIVEVLARAAAAMRKAFVFEEGQMFMYLPSVAEIALATSPFGYYYTTGMSLAPIAKGSVGKEIAGTFKPLGFEFVMGDFCPEVVDPTTGDLCHYIVFGRKRATGFVQQIEEMEVVGSEFHFGKYTRGLHIYGHKPLLSEALGVMYVRFQ